MSNKEIDIHMSNLDEEAKRILKMVDSDESKDSSKKDEKKDVKKSDIDWETNDIDTDDSEW